MPIQPRRKKISTSDSSNASPSSSSDDEEISPTNFSKTVSNKINELTLKDDEDIMNFQAPLPEYYGKIIYYK